MHSEGISRVEIAIGREGVQLSGDVAHALRFSMDRFFSTLPRLPSERCIDLLYIAAGIYAVDRLTRHQHPLPLPSTYQPTRAALYSGGLDSAAGLANQLISDIEDYVLVTVGHQSLVRKKSERIHTSWRVAGKSHCGTCPACIERRQAFAAAGIPEADYYSTDVLKSPPKAGPDADYMHLYIDEARAWIKGDERPRRRFENHLRFTDVPQSEDTQFARLLTTHCNEVTSVFHH
jgi:hypothetical protein